MERAPWRLGLLAGGEGMGEHEGSVALGRALRRNGDRGDPGVRKAKGLSEQSFLVPVGILVVFCSCKFALNLNPMSTIIPLYDGGVDGKEGT